MKYCLMDKKDIYEHLANIYLDASSKRKKKSRAFPKLFKNLMFLGSASVFLLTAFLVARFSHRQPANSEIALLLCPDVVKINFHFDPAKKETYAVSLNNLDLSRYRTLAFSVKKMNYKDTISLRVEFTSAFKESSVVYFKDIPSKWQDYKINLSEFKGINDWSNMSGLSFVVEEWNVREKKGIVYLDNVRFLK